MIEHGHDRRSRDQAQARAQLGPVECRGLDPGIDGSGFQGVAEFFGCDLQLVEIGNNGHEVVALEDVTIVGVAVEARRRLTPEG